MITVIANAFIMAAEVATVAAIAWLGYYHPLIFAGVTAVLAFALGLYLEIARLKFELPFYFERPPQRSALIAVLVGGGEAFVKALLAGVVALLTFLGTDAARLQWVAIIFAVALFAGTSLLRWLSLRFGARPLRWGYFRLAAPLGLMFSAGLAFLPSPGLTELAKRVTFELPARPNLEQGSEFLFLLKQTFDDIVVRLLGLVFPADWAEAIGVIVSVNMLSGLVLAIYAMLIAATVRRAEDTLT